MASKYAFLIGVNTYDSFKHLRYAVDDIELINSNLVELNSFDPFSITKIGDQGPIMPMRGNIIVNFLKLLGKMTEDDVLLIYFCGHGFSHNNEDYIVPSDGNTLDPNQVCLPLRYFYEKIIENGLSKVLFVIDACRDNLIIGERGGGNFPSNILEFSEINGIVTIFSCNQGEKSIELDEFEHGIFSYYFSEILQTPFPNSFSIHSLFEEISSKVKLKTENQQNPEININNLDSFKDTDNNFIVFAKEDVVGKYYDEIQQEVNGILATRIEDESKIYSIEIPNEIGEQIHDRIRPLIFGNSNIEFFLQRNGNMIKLRFEIFPKEAVLNGN